jgi:hypothetical protein
MTLVATMILELKVKLSTILKEESMLMIDIIHLLIIFPCHSIPSCMLQMVTLLNLFLMLVTIMKEEVISFLFMLLIIISCIYLQLICNGIPLFLCDLFIWKCQCIGRKINFSVACYIFCVALYCVPP